jgi:hypothetical protein
MQVAAGHPSHATLVLGLTALLLGACATHTPMPIDDVVQRSRQGQTADQIVGQLRSSRTTFALRGSDFGRLAQAGVADPVLDHLQQSFVNDVDLQTRYWATGESLGGCRSCYPQQVDLSGLDSGGAAQQRPPSTYYAFSQPPGMPDWYRPYSAKRRTISLDDVRRMARQGTSTEEMVRAVRSARLDRTIGVAGLGTVRTHPVAGLSGSELARLRAEGLPDPVLDEIQNAFVSQFVELQRLRYQHLGKGPSFS